MTASTSAPLATVQREGVQQQHDAIGGAGTLSIGPGSSYFAAFDGTNSIKEKLTEAKVCSLLVNRPGMLGRWLYGALLLFIAVALSACAAGPKVVNHAFGFDARIDSPRFEVLAYRYADGDVVARSSDSAIRQFGHSSQWEGINGPMPLGSSLYVKWREKSSGQAYEDTVDLRPLLPNDMTGQRIHFVVDGPRLYVYLKDMNRYANPMDPIVGPFKLQVFVTRQIYPR